MREAFLLEEKKFGIKSEGGKLFAQSWWCMNPVTRDPQTRTVGRSLPRSLRTHGQSRAKQAANIFVEIEFLTVRTIFANVHLAAFHLYSEVLRSACLACGQ